MTWQAADRNEWSADVREPLYYGPHTAVAYDVVLGLRSTRDLLASLGTEDTGHALERLRTLLAAHDTGNGVFFGPRAWIITVRHH